MMLDTLIVPFVHHRKFGFMFQPVFASFRPDIGFTLFLKLQAAYLPLFHFPPIILPSRCRVTKALQPKWSKLSDKRKYSFPIYSEIHEFVQYIFQVRNLYIYIINDCVFLCLNKIN